MVYYNDRCFFLCFKETLSLQQKLLHRDELASTFFMCKKLNFNEHGEFIGPIAKVNGALTGWQVEPQDSFFQSNLLS